MPLFSHKQKQEAATFEFDHSLSEDAKKKFILSLNVVPEAEVQLYDFLFSALDDPLPAPWEERVDQKGRVFYWNPSSRISAWHHPFATTFGSIVAAYRRVAHSDDHMPAIGAEIAAAHTQGMVELQEWRMTTSPEGAAYYYHVETQETRWDNPRDELQAHLDLRLRFLSSLAERVSELPSSSPDEPSQKKKRISIQSDEVSVQAAQADRVSSKADSVSSQSPPRTPNRWGSPLNAPRGPRGEMEPSQTGERDVKSYDNWAHDLLVHQPSGSDAAGHLRDVLGSESPVHAQDGSRSLDVVALGVVDHASASASASASAFENGGISEEQATTFESSRAIPVDEFLNADLYMLHLGIVIEDAVDRDIMQILRPLLFSPLPTPWSAVEYDDGIGFYHRGLRLFTWKHPVEAIFKDFIEFLRYHATSRVSLSGALASKLQHIMKAEVLQSQFGIWEGPLGANMARYRLSTDTETMKSGTHRSDDPRREVAAHLQIQLKMLETIWSNTVFTEPFPFVAESLEQLPMQMAERVIKQKESPGQPSREPSQEPAEKKKEPADLKASESQDCQSPTKSPTNAELDEADPAKVQEATAYAQSNLGLAYGKVLLAIAEDSIEKGSAEPAAEAPSSEAAISKAKPMQSEDSGAAPKTSDETSLQSSSQSAVKDETSEEQVIRPEIGEEACPPREAPETTRVDTSSGEQAPVHESPSSPAHPVAQSSTVATSSEDNISPCEPSESKVPESNVPEAKAPEAEVPEAKVPESNVPEAKAPEAEVAEDEGTPTMEVAEVAEAPTLEHSVPRGGLGPRGDGGDGLSPEVHGLHFSGNGYVEVKSTTGVPMENSPRTVSVAFYPTRARCSNLISWGDGHSTGKRFSLHLVPRSGKVVPAFCGQNNDHFKEGDHGVPLNQWAHAAVTYDGHNISLFVNGSHIGTACAGQLNTDANAKLFLGKNTENRRDEYFVGSMCCAQIWKRVLSEEEIKDVHSSSQVPKNRLVADWDFKSTGDCLHDHTDNNHHGHIVALKWGQQKDDNLAAEDGSKSAQSASQELEMKSGQSASQELEIKSGESALQELESNSAAVAVDIVTEREQSNDIDVDIVHADESQSKDIDVDILHADESQLVETSHDLAPGDEQLVSETKVLASHDLAPRDEQLVSETKVQENAADDFHTSEAVDAPPEIPDLEDLLNEAAEELGIEPFSPTNEADGTNGELPDDKCLEPPVESPTQKEALGMESPAESPTQKEALGMESQHEADPGHGISDAARDESSEEEFEQFSEEEFEEPPESSEESSTEEEDEEMKPGENGEIPITGFFEIPSSPSAAAAAAAPVELPDPDPEEAELELEVVAPVVTAPSAEEDECPGEGAPATSVGTALPDALEDDPTTMAQAVANDGSPTTNMASPRSPSGSPTRKRPTFWSEKSKKEEEKLKNAANDGADDEKQESIEPDSQCEIIPDDKERDLQPQDLEQDSYSQEDEEEKIDTNDLDNAAADEQSPEAQDDGIEMATEEAKETDNKVTKKPSVKKLFALSNFVSLATQEDDAVPPLPPLTPPGRLTEGCRYCCLETMDTIAVSEDIWLPNAFQYEVITKPDLNGMYVRSIYKALQSQHAINRFIPSAAPGAEVPAAPDSRGSSKASAPAGEPPGGALTVSPAKQSSKDRAFNFKHARRNTQLGFGHVVVDSYIGDVESSHHHYEEQVGDEHAPHMAAFSKQSRKKTTWDLTRPEVNPIEQRRRNKGVELIDTALPVKGHLARPPTPETVTTREIPDCEIRGTGAADADAAADARSNSQANLGMHSDGFPAGPRKSTKDALRDSSAAFAAFSTGPAFAALERKVLGTQSGKDHEVHAKDHFVPRGGTPPYLSKEQLNGQTFFKETPKRTLSAGRVRAGMPWPSPLTDTGQHLRRPKSATSKTVEVHKFAKQTFHPPHEAEGGSIPPEEEPSSPGGSAQNTAAAAPPGVTGSSMATAAMQSVKKYLTRHWGNLQKGFQQLDDNHTGLVTREQWVRNLARIEYPPIISSSDLFDELDIQGHGLVTLSDLINPGVSTMGVNSSLPSRGRQPVVSNLLTDVLEEQTKKVVQEALSDLVKDELMRVTGLQDIPLPSLEYFAAMEEIAHEQELAEEQEVQRRKSMLEEVAAIKTGDLYAVPESRDVDDLFADAGESDSEVFDEDEDIDKGLRRKGRRAAMDVHGGVESTTTAAHGPGTAGSNDRPDSRGDADDEEPDSPDSTGSRKPRRRSSAGEESPIMAKYNEALKAIAHAQSERSTGQNPDWASDLQDTLNSIALDIPELAALLDRLGWSSMTSAILTDPPDVDVLAEEVKKLAEKAREEEKQKGHEVQAEKAAKKLNALNAKAESMSETLAMVTKMKDGELDPEAVADLKEHLKTLAQENPDDAALAKMLAMLDAGDLSDLGELENTLQGEVKKTRQLQRRQTKILEVHQPPLADESKKAEEIMLCATKALELLMQANKPNLDSQSAAEIESKLKALIEENPEFRAKLEAAGVNVSEDDILSDPANVSLLIQTLQGIVKGAEKMQKKQQKALADSISSAAAQQESMSDALALVKSAAEAQKDGKFDKESARKTLASLKSSGIDDPDFDDMVAKFEEMLEQADEDGCIAFNLNDISKSLNKEIKRVEKVQKNQSEALEKIEKEKIAEAQQKVATAAKAAEAVTKAIEAGDPAALAQLREDLQALAAENPELCTVLDNLDQGGDLTQIAEELQATMKKAEKQQKKAEKQVDKHGGPPRRSDAVTHATMAEAADVLASVSEMQEKQASGTLTYDEFRDLQRQLNDLAQTSPELSETLRQCGWNPDGKLVLGELSNLADTLGKVSSGQTPKTPVRKSLSMPVRPGSSYSSMSSSDSRLDSAGVKSASSRGLWDDDRSSTPASSRTAQSLSRSQTHGGYQLDNKLDALSVELDAFPKPHARRRMQPSLCQQSAADVYHAYKHVSNIVIGAGKVTRKKSRHRHIIDLQRQTDRRDHEPIVVPSANALLGQTWTSYIEDEASQDHPSALASFGKLRPGAFGGGPVSQTQFSDASTKASTMFAATQDNWGRTALGSAHSQLPKSASATSLPSVQAKKFRLHTPEGANRRQVRTASPAFPQKPGFKTHSAKWASMQQKKAW